MIPEIKVKNRKLYSQVLNRNGSMCNAYSPLKNLLDENDTLGDFTTEKLKFDLEHPVDILLQDSYDGSVNMILNDAKNQPRLIGSRFSVLDDKQFKITDHTGFKDTNIYDSETFDLDTSLKTIAQKIPTIEFAGVTLFAGSLPCGCYTFYFKLADADGNESEILAESGIVLLFIGGVSKTTSADIIQPTSMRMGTENESSGKSVTFNLSNIDSGFDYVHVLYARSSSSNDQASVDTYHKIVYDYPVTDGKAIINITGNETILGISADELYVNYADLESVKTLSVVNNVLFFGNLTKKERDWDALRIASWKILPTYGSKENVGTIDFNYTVGGDNPKEVGAYYNPYNIYYRVGYWPDEIYRFGVVYIFNDNSLSPVFNIQGVDFTKNDFKTNESFLNLFNKVESDGNVPYYKLWEAEPEDYYFNEKYRLNSRGVIKFPKEESYKIEGGILRPKPLYINFNLSYIGATQLDSTGNMTSGQSFSDFCLSHDIKGLFFVRQKRIPTILGLGLAIGLTKKDFGSVPVIKNGADYEVQSFLNTDLLVLPEGKTIRINSTNVSENALLFPDAELSEDTYNLLFTSNKYSLFNTDKLSFLSENYRQYVNRGIYLSKETVTKRKLTTVPEDTKILTDGEIYFSTLAGNAHEPYKTSDVNLAWNKTVPQLLTVSDSVIRGLWGHYVGVGEKEVGDPVDILYGNVYNIKLENYADNIELATKLDFLKRFTSAETYSSICDRTEITNLNNCAIDCYRGDCFQSLFTHRMFRNFIDPELPTNDKIINPNCWALNYAVRCTAVPDVKLHGNLTADLLGFVISPDATPPFANEIVLAFEVKDYSDIKDEPKWDTTTQLWYIGELPKDTTSTTTNESEGSSESAESSGTSSKTSEFTYLGTAVGSYGSVSSFLTILDVGGSINVVHPTEQETGIGGILKNIFKSNKWTLRGLASINRADVNAVGLGQWITFPICSSKNLALRDIDYSNATEQAEFNRKRSFYPLLKMDIHNPLRDSNVINLAAGISLPHKHYYAMPNVPFIKQEYFTRVINSLRDSASSVTNEFKVMLESAYKDYTKIYGPITKLMPLGSKMLVVFHHGLGILALNDLMSNAENALLYLPAELSMVLSTSYGSMWKDSIIETQGYIYGIDSVAKVIWRVSSEPKLEIISQLKVEKFLIDSLEMSEFTTKPYIGHINIKTHYNAFKHDVIFTYYNDVLYKFDSDKYDEKTLSDWEIDSEGYLLNDDKTRSDYKGVKVTAQYDSELGKVITYSDMIGENPYLFKWVPGKSWSLCYNELLGKFVTFYDWIPLESENIDNVWFSFDREAANALAEQGFHNSYPSAVPPKQTKAGLVRDENYPKNSIDPAFNNTCAITYIDKDKSIQFNFNLQQATEEYPNLVNVIGLYLKPGSSYDVSLLNIIGAADVVRARMDYDLTADTSWKFVVFYPHIITENATNFGIKITSKTNRGACTDCIIKQIEDLTISGKDKSEIHPTSDETLNLDDYYFVRDLGNSLKLWKHGLAGVYDNERDIKPTYWYGQQHEFNFEFIARKDALHKVFNNLLIISNKTEPNKFEFEVVGEVYDWHKYKPVLKWIIDHVSVPVDHIDYEQYLLNKFIDVLGTNYGTLCRTYNDFPRVFGMKTADYFTKLPYLKVTDARIPTLDTLVIGKKIGEKDKPDVYLKPEDRSTATGQAYSDNTNTTCLVYDKQLNEFRVHTELLGNDMQKYGRLRGNMQYLEDLWKIEIRPIAFKYCYLNENNELQFTKVLETRHRDKYIKIKIRYSGEDLAIIQAISTLFDYSLA